MKPIKNITKPFFEIGRTYQVRNDMEITLHRMAPCRMGCDFKSCLKLILTDTIGRVWCSKEIDFKLVK